MIWYCWKCGHQAQGDESMPDLILACSVCGTLMHDEADTERAAIIEEACGYSREEAEERANEKLNQDA